MSFFSFISFTLLNGFPPPLHLPSNLETNYIPGRQRSGDKGLASGFRLESILQPACKILQVALRVERLMLSDANWYNNYRDIQISLSQSSLSAPEGTGLSLQQCSLINFWGQHMDLHCQVSDPVSQQSPATGPRQCQPPRAEAGLRPDSQGGSGNTQIHRDTKCGAPMNAPRPEPQPETKTQGRHFTGCFCFWCSFLFPLMLNQLRV